MESEKKTRENVQGEEKRIIFLGNKKQRYTQISNYGNDKKMHQIVESYQTE